MATRVKVYGQGDNIIVIDDVVDVPNMMLNVSRWVFATKSGYVVVIPANVLGVKVVSTSDGTEDD